ncbi:MAG: hypothetical protein JW763_07840 [candidate division Zixibacteria bacterium]|nr:hypothetical protein [candidate division Zixibacteria bacterium]
MVLIPLVAGAQRETHYKGVIGFKAGHDIISFQNGAIGLVFDTAECTQCKDSLPSWRCLESLKVDSVIYRKRTIALEDSILTADYETNSIGLLDILHDINCRSLVRRMPWFDPSDTLGWDPVRKETRIRKDLSIHFKITFGETINLDSLSSKLNAVPNILSTGKIPIYYEG